MYHHKVSGDEIIGTMQPLGPKIVQEKIKNKNLL